MKQMVNIPAKRKLLPLINRCKFAGCEKRWTVNGEEDDEEEEEDAVEFDENLGHGALRAKLYNLLRRVVIDWLFFVRQISLSVTRQGDAVDADALSTDRRGDGGGGGWTCLRGGGAGGQLVAVACSSILFFINSSDIPIEDTTMPYSSIWTNGHFSEF